MYLHDTSVVAAAVLVGGLWWGTAGWMVGVLWWVLWWVLESVVGCLGMVGMIGCHYVLLMGRRSHVLVLCLLAMGVDWWVVMLQ